MKLFNYIIITAFALLTFSCYGQKNNNSHISKNDTITEIIDPIEKMPFSIERDSVYLRIPDSLGVNQKGFAVLGFLINDKSKIENIKILRLHIKENDIVLIDYTQDLQNTEYDTNNKMKIQRYYQLLEDYTKTLKIIKTSENVPKLTRMNLIVRFK